MSPEILILNENRDLIHIFDDFASFIWTERFLGAGEFELKIPASIDAMDVLKPGNLTSIHESEELMIIEEVTTDITMDEGPMLVVTGRSLPSILDRRVILEATTVKDLNGMTQNIIDGISISGSLQNGIKTLLTKCVINPKDTNRRIPNFTFIESRDPAITSLEVDASYRGDNLYDVVYDLCNTNKIGFRVLPTDNGGFSFELYNGTDRSWNQNALPYVVFSSDYENLVSTNYLKNTKEYKNDVYVEKVIRTTKTTYENGNATTETEDISTFEEVYTNATSGLNRRENVINPSISYPDPEKEEDKGRNYSAEIRDAGKESLNETKVIEAIDGELESDMQFSYGVDYFIGDIVQVVNEYGIEATCRITEYVIAYDSSGETKIPTFEFINDDE